MEEASYLDPTRWEKTQTLSLTHAGLPFGAGLMEASPLRSLWSKVGLIRPYYRS